MVDIGRHWVDICAYMCILIMDLFIHQLVTGWGPHLVQIGCHLPTFHPWNDLMTITGFFLSLTSDTPNRHTQILDLCLYRYNIWVCLKMLG